MPSINPVTKDQLFEKKIAENTGSDYNVGDISDVVPVTKDQALLKEIALNSAGQSGDITELEEKVADNTGAIEAIVNEYGAKNMLDLNLDEIKALNTTGTWNNNVYTLDAMTFTVNDDMSIVMSGSISRSDNFVLKAQMDMSKYSGMLINGNQDDSSITLQVMKPSLPYEYYVSQYSGVDSQISTIPSQYTVQVRIRITTAVSNVNRTIKPMIRDARITDPTYVPYAMTNRELTERIVYKTITLTPTSAGADLYEYINHPDSRTPKFIVAQCIAPSENASSNLNMWWQTFDVNGQSLLRYVASNANLTYTVALCYFY